MLKLKSSISSSRMVDLVTRGLFEEMNFIENLIIYKYLIGK